MKKLANILLSVIAISAFGAMTAYSAVIPQRQYQANVQSKRMSRGTTLKLQLLDPASTFDSTAGDMFQGMLVENKIDDGVMILPKGTIFRGTVSNIVPSKRLSRGAVLYLDLDHVVTPTGKQIPVKSALMSNGIVLTVDGGIKAGGNYGYALQKNWETATNIMGNCLDWGETIGEKTLGGYPKYVTIPVSGAVGVVGGFAYYIGDAFVDLFKKGGEVTLHQGSEIEFILTDAIDIPVN